MLQVPLLNTTVENIDCHRGAGVDDRNNSMTTLGTNITGEEHDIVN